MYEGILGADMWPRRKWERRTESFEGIIGSIWIIANLQVKTAKENKVVFTVWHGARKHVACLRTVKSMVENMITGVTKVSWKLSIGLAGYRFEVLAGYRGGIESQWVSGWRGGSTLR